MVSDGVVGLVEPVLGPPVIPFGGAGAGALGLQPDSVNIVNADRPIRALFRLRPDKQVL